MAIDLERLRALEVTDMRFAYGEREIVLYALSVGMGRDPLDAHELPFVLPLLRVVAEHLADDAVNHAGTERLEASEQPEQRAQKAGPTGC